MKRKNIILSTILSLTILIGSACAADDYSSTTVVSSDTTTFVSETVAADSENAADENKIEEEPEETSAEEAETAAGDEATDAIMSETTTESVTTTEVVTTTVETTTAQTATEATTASESVTITEVTTPETEETTVTTTETTTAEEVIEKKYIALTFDDGPNTTTTNEVLDVLEQYGIKGSFFLIGNNINADNESVVKRAYDMGCDIGNHSKSHPYMNELTAEEIKTEIEYVNEYIVKITGEEPKFFRPPYIAVNNTMYDNIDLTFISGFGCNDWDDKVPSDRRAKVILRQAQDGGIILLHDAQGNSKTVEALHTIIPELQAQGYEFVTLTELFEIKGVTINPDDSNLYTFVGQ